MKTTRKARKGERCRTFAQRNVNEIPDGLLLSTVAAGEPRLQREEIRSEMRARSDRKREASKRRAPLYLEARVAAV